VVARAQQCPANPEVWAVPTPGVLEFPEDHRAPDSVAWFERRGETPTIASLSDVHGYLEAARSALTAVGDSGRPPLVTVDADGRLHWAGNDYLLVLNGDLIDRGPANEECVALLERLLAEAPPGRVRYHLGNHEMAVPFRDAFGWAGQYSVERPADERRAVAEAVADGAMPAALEGYRYTYSHAGDNAPVDAASVNETAREGVAALLADSEAWASSERQREVMAEYDRVYGLGGPRGRGPDAGLLWMDFRHVTPDAPPQVVGHSRQTSPTVRGSVVCQNVIRETLHDEGGEAVVLETPDGLEAVVREADGVGVRDLDAEVRT